MVIHVVKQGDTIYNLSKIYGVKPLQIIEENGLIEPNDLVIGQALVIGENNNKGLEKIDVFGYTYTNIKESVLLEALTNLTALNIFNYMVNSCGNLFPINDEDIIEKALEYQVAPIMVLTNLKQNSGFSSEIMQKILNDDYRQDILINSILCTIKDKGYYGVDADFEYIYADDKEEYEDFLRKLATVLHAEGYILSVALAPKANKKQKGILYEGHDYEVIGDIADRILLMTYEWGYILGPPMAVAPINEVEKVIDYAVTEIDSKKILMGIPNYGYDWTLPYEEGRKAKVVSNPEAIEIAKKYGGEIQFDEESMSPYFYYYDENRKKHVVWFEDARSIEAKLKLVTKYNLGGVFYWTVMKPFKQNWTVLENMFNVKKFIE